MKNDTNERMGLAPIAIVGIIAAVLLAGGAWYYARHSLDIDQTAKNVIEERIAEQEGDTRMDAKTEEMMKKDGEVISGTSTEVIIEQSSFMGAVLAGTSAPLLDFRKADYDKAVASGKLILLYFYADWCPICKAEFPKMQAVFNGLTTAKIVGFRVNYKDDFTDADEIALARQFGVAYQHTKVFVRGGTLVSKHPDGWDEARYQSEIAARIK